MTTNAPRIPPIADDAADPTQRELLEGARRDAVWDGNFAGSVTAAQRELLDRTRGDDGYTMNIFRTMAHHPDLARRWMVFATHILAKSTLAERDRELAILRIGWLCRSSYEWGQHVLIARRIGMSDEEIRRVQSGPEAAGWDEKDRAILRATDDLHRDAKISDSVWESLSENYNTQQLMDIVFTVGQYNLVSMALNSFGVQLDPGTPTFEI